MRQWMTNHALLVKIIAIILAIGLTATASVVITTNVLQGEQGSAGPQGEQGEAGNGVSSITKTSTEGLVDTYTIIFTDGTTTTFTVTNGADGEQGIQGIQGEKGEDGHTPVITIQNGRWYIDGVDTGKSAEGVKGDTGNGISSIAKTKTEGLVDTYTITFTNGDTTTFTVTNGTPGAQGAQGIQGIQGEKGADGHTPVITIQNGKWYIDGVDSGKSAEGIKGDTGNGISSIAKTNTVGLVDTYTITFTNGDTTTFTVTNGTPGAQGEQGVQGIQGVPGKDGHTPVITIENGKWYIDGVDTGKSADGLKGDTGNGISDITKTSTEGLVDTYTITYTNGTSTTFTVTNGAQGIQGIQGEKGEDGHSPVITIQNGYWYIDGVNTNESATEGIKGDTGNGISSIAKTKTEGLVDTYTITFTNGDTTTFTVTNGTPGVQGEQGVQGIQGVPGKDGHTPVITIENGRWYIDGVDTGKSAEGIKGDTGNGISSIAKTKTEGLVDTYTITFTNGDTTTFTVTNGTPGAQGAQGIQGIQGEKGADGHTPVITIQNGKWYIDGVDSGKSAEGIKGDTGNGISSIAKTNTVGLVDTYTITFTNGETTTFTVTNGADGAQGEQGIQGVPGKDGHTPVITIENGRWYIDGVDTGKSAIGVAGNGIEKIEKTKTEGLVDTYTITYTNGSSTTFTVTNGATGSQGIQGIQGEKGADGHTPVITIQNGRWYIDGVDSGKSAEGVKGDTGNGISSITKTKTEGLIDTYTITFTNGDTTTFTVTNGAAGAQGEQGIQGIQGEKGEDGHTPVITIQNGRWYIDGVDSGKSAEGVKGDTGNGISSITKTSTVGLVDIYTITFTNGDTTTFTVTNGAAGAQGEQGIQGIQGEKGEDGHTPVITIQNGRWYIDGVDSGKSAEGVKGDTGNGISSISKTNTVGLVDTYTITFTNGDTTIFTVTNGAEGAQGEQGIQGIQGEKGADGHTPVITIQNGRWYIDGVDSGKSAEGVKGDTGNGISSITKTKTEGLIDTYTITFTNGDTTTFTVTNGAAGAQGEQGIQGIQGEKGEDGHTPVITIQNGRWYIDGVDSGVLAEGLKGETGNGISSIEKTKTEGLVDTYTITFTNGNTTTFTVTNGAQGEPGVGITNAYINSEVHLILVLSNGTEIDAGYVGVTVTPNPTTYTVTFVDYNGTVLKTETVESGKDATAPSAPSRKGYIFTGWSDTYSNVTAKLEVTAQYSIAHNQLYFTYKDNADGTFTATLTMCGDVNFYGLEMSVNMQSMVGLSFVNVSATANGAIANYNGENITFSYANITGKDNKAETKLLDINFDITGSAQNIVFEISNVDVFDENYNDETYVVASNTYAK